MLKQEEFESIILWVQEKINGEKYEISWGIGDNVSGINQNTINNLPKLLDYTSYVESKGKKKVKKVEAISAEYLEHWKDFWKLWPSTKSVPGTQFKSGAVMKKSEAKMMAKWHEAIKQGKISISSMNYAANCYLQWAYHDSIFKGRNELQYRNSMEVWLNGEVYLTYVDVPMPPTQNTTIYQNSTDM